MIGRVILERIVAGVFGENCYLLVPEATARPGRRRALVVDPGAGVADAVAELLERFDAELGAVLLTHAHADHVWDCAAVAGDAPVYVPAPDRYRLADPLGQTSVLTHELLRQLPGPWKPPATVRTLPDALLQGGGAELLPGIHIRALPAPGHTEGSTLYFLNSRWPGHVAQWLGRPTTTTEGATQALVFSGDVLFRGSVGRTDLPGGDAEVMAWTLRTLKQAVDPDTWVMPGHGPATTMDHELLTNPFLSLGR